MTAMSWGFFMGTSLRGSVAEPTRGACRVHVAGHRRAFAGVARQARPPRPGQTERSNAGRLRLPSSFVRVRSPRLPGDSLSVVVKVGECAPTGYGHGRTRFLTRSWPGGEASQAHPAREGGIARPGTDSPSLSPRGRRARRRARIDGPHAPVCLDSAAGYDQPSTATARGASVRANR